jgi:hypothetical protein
VRGLVAAMMPSTTYVIPRTMYPIFPTSLRGERSRDLSYRNARAGRRIPGTNRRIHLVNQLDIWMREKGCCKSGRISGCGGFLHFLAVKEYPFVFPKI